jgi:NAD(P)-dependent dehydrogenase (short-subunit alcohol dehydrogenase family)
MDYPNLPFSKLVVLVTGGTQGLGKAIGLEFACAGATTYLTHRWGSADEDELRGEFQARGATEPHIVESDVSDHDAMRELMTEIKRESGHLDVVVSNVAFAKVINELSDLKKNALDLSLSYSAWPVVELTQMARDVFGTYPRYVIGVSSNGGDVCYEGYDLVGASKAVLETLCRYLAFRLKRYGVRVNVIRPGLLNTASARSTFGNQVVDSVAEQMGDIFLAPQSVAKACLALCSGWLDAVTGQVIVVDEGWSLVSPIAYVTGHGSPGSFPRQETSNK